MPAFTELLAVLAVDPTNGAGSDNATDSVLLAIGTKMTILPSHADNTSVTCRSRTNSLTGVLETAAYRFHISDTDYLTG
jgi:hypothetical protein